MKKLNILIPAVLVGVFLLSACTGAQTSTPVGTMLASTATMVVQPSETATEVMATETEVVSETATLAPTVAPTATSLAGLPATGGEVEALTEMMRYRVVDNAGNELGLVRDFILNTCEAHILYIVMDAANSSQSVLVPFEAVSLNQNRPENAAADTLVVSFDASLLASVPIVDLKTVDFESSNWDAAVMAFWKQNIPISLTTACNVPSSWTTPVPALTATPLVTATAGTPVATVTSAPSATAPVETATPEPSETPAALSGYLPAALLRQATATLTPLTASPTPVATITGTVTASDRTNVYKIVRASDLVGVNVVDIRGNMLAKVRDALVFKRTGGVQYFVVQLVAGNQQDADGNMVALAPGAVNLFWGDDYLRLTPVTGTATATPLVAQAGTATAAATLAVTATAAPEVVQVGNADGKPVLLLLVDASVLRNAPAISIVNGQVDQETSDYWNQYFPRPTLAPTSATPAGSTSTPVPSLTPTP